jgi:hypothetical protein
MAEGMVQGVKCLSCKQEALTSNPVLKEKLKN